MLRLHRSVFAAVLILAGCGEAIGPDAVPEPDPAPSLAPSLATSGGTFDMTAFEQELAKYASAAGLMTCKPQPALSVSQVVGSAGGVIQIGKHKLEIPKGALRKSVTITAVAVADSFNSIRFGPEGLKFTKTASLTLDYANCWIPALLSAAYVAFVDENKNILERTTSVDYRNLFIVVGEIKHFSRYAVAW